MNQTCRRNRKLFYPFFWYSFSSNINIDKCCLMLKICVFVPLRHEDASTNYLTPELKCGRKLILNTYIPVLKIL